MRLEFCARPSAASRSQREQAPGRDRCRQAQWRSAAGEATAARPPSTIRNPQTSRGRRRPGLSGRGTKRSRRGRVLAETPSDTRLFSPRWTKQGGIWGDTENPLDVKRKAKNLGFAGIRARSSVGERSLHTRPRASWTARPSAIAQASRSTTPPTAAAALDWCGAPDEKDAGARNDGRRCPLTVLAVSYGCR